MHHTLATLSTGLVVETIASQTRVPEREDDRILELRRLAAEEGSHVAIGVAAGMSVVKARQRPRAFRPSQP